VADFALLKEKVTLEQAAQMLGLTLHLERDKLRGECPACDSSNRRALVLTPSKSVWYCWGAHVGGSVIDLVAHIRKVDLKDAADELADHFGIGTKRTAPTVPPAPQRAQEREAGLKPLDYLDHDHAAVEAVGFDPETARALGIGWASKGLMRGMVAVPVRLEDGTLAGYIGVQECRLPPKWTLTSNVVKLKTA